MPKYKITYNEGNFINKKEEIEANDSEEALMIFIQNHPNADFSDIRKVGKE